MLVRPNDALELAIKFYKEKYGEVTSSTTETQLYIRSALISFAEYIKRECPHDGCATSYFLHKYVKSMPVLSINWFKHCAPVIVEFITPDK
jgi:hypothetical protein